MGSLIMPRPSLPFQCSEEETARPTLLPCRGGATIFFMRTCFDVVLAGGRETEGGGSGEGDQLQAGGWRHTPELRMTCDRLWFWHQSIDCHWPLGDRCSVHSAPPPSPKQNPVWGSGWQFINWAPPGSVLNEILFQLLQSPSSEGEEKWTLTTT